MKNEKNSVGFSYAVFWHSVPAMLRLALFLALSETAFLFRFFFGAGTLFSGLFARFLLELQGLLGLGAYAGLLSQLPVDLSPRPFGVDALSLDVLHGDGWTKGQMSPVI